ncbi:TerD family protein [Catenuloplanes japonicus]|uniref:TerD family protein n=1 Tax=Catenuloplanes japonicus TaxID=33876 RepID=UPI000525F482|nr:TerD family protein [Catenuloplanes japonicus]
MAIELEPGQTMALRGIRGNPARIRMGLAWTSARPPNARWWQRVLRWPLVDLDASALLFDASGELVDTVWFGRLVSKDGAVRHSGDNLTGRGEGDLESIRVDLAALPAGVVTIVFTVNSFTGQAFTRIDRASCRLVDETTGEEELGSFDLSVSGPHTAQIMAKLTRADNSWTMTAIGAAAGGRTYDALLPAVRAELGRADG